MYDINSKVAEEFISDEEILSTLSYAKEHSQNKSLILSILEKARQAKGLNHREAAILLECRQEDLIEQMFATAKELKERFYGNRIVMFAPLYLSNYCVNGCTYCPYHAKNKHIPRKKLSQEEIKKETIALQ
ncbi:MAG TPA: [FeFe] hydrogenase H-cluster radical SAM maturase HydG, partial [Lachnospiraceae bacterium]